MVNIVLLTNVTNLNITANLLTPALKVAKLVIVAFFLGAIVCVCIYCTSTICIPRV